MFGRYKESGLDRNPENDTPFDEVKPLIEADIAVLNLESALLRDPPSQCPWPSTLRFAAGVWAADAIDDAGFTVASLANNHSYDMKGNGLKDTRELLRERGITPVGVARETDTGVAVVTLSSNGWEVGFIGFSSLLNSLTLADDPTMPYFPDAGSVPEALGPAIQGARHSLDLIVVLAHWGRSDEDVPTAERRAASKALIDMGADLVIGHHPHRLQGIEYYNGGLIAHSLGDFIFDKHRDPNRLTGVLRVRYEPSKEGVARVSFHPVVLTRDAWGIRPRPAGRNSAKTVYDRLQRLSAPLGTDWTPDGDTHFEMNLDDVN